MTSAGGRIVDMNDGGLSTDIPPQFPIKCGTSWTYLEFLNNLLIVARHGDVNHLHMIRCVQHCSCALVLVRASGCGEPKNTVSATGWSLPVPFLGFYTPLAAIKYRVWT